MNAWLILFIASGLCMVLMITLKVLQERWGLLLFWPDQREHVEKYLNRKGGSLSDILDEKTFLLIAYKILVGIRKIFSRIQRRLERATARLTRLISGRQAIEPQGKASHFLHDIRSYKDTFKKE